MLIQVDIPDYDAINGIQYNWVLGFEIEIKLINNALLIRANKEGLESLANHLLNLSQNNVPSGAHMHFDENNSLEEGSIELIIEKKGDISN